MATAIGDRQEWVSLQTIAAATQQTVYFPVGRPDGISAAARAVGNVRRLLLKQAFLKGYDTNIRIYEIGIYTIAGEQVPLLQVFQGTAGTGVPPPGMTYSMHTYDLLNTIEDCECVYMTVGNVHASDSKTYACGIRYVPLR